MSVWLNSLLLVVFAIHLVAFAWLGFRRRERYYLALVITFGLLTAAFTLRLVAPAWPPGGLPAHAVLRYAAWCAAAVSLSWTALRIRQRRARAVKSRIR